MLKNKVAIVTGANQGLGYEIARQYLEAGAAVTICARNAAMLDEAREKLLAATGSDLVLAVAVDVSDPLQTQTVVEQTTARFGRLDILVNNAGVYGPKGPSEDVDWDAWMQAIQINLFGSVLMCRAVLPTLKQQGSGKIIQLSGGGATNPMPNISAYATSKAAIIRFAESVAEEVRELHIDVNAIAPGALNTRMLDEVLAAGPEKIGQAFYEKSLKQKENGGAGLIRAAELAVFLGSDASNGITGKLISALWDDWEHWPQHLDELNKSDAYTLRRLTGRDRGLNWGDK